MTESFDECPDCGCEEIDTWTAEVEYGSPTNLHSRGAVAPNYRTNTITRGYCPECDWNIGF